MKKEPIFVSVCTPKGGMGKTTFSILLASLLHYGRKMNVLVVDADFPQWSIHEQRDREMKTLEKSNFFKLMMIRQFDRTGQRIYPVLHTTPQEAVSKTMQFLKESPLSFDLVVYDLPGTINADGVLYTLSCMDHVFIPMKADMIVMESTVSFASILNEQILTQPESNLKGIHLFWTMIDRRERTVMYEQYEKVLDVLGLQKMETHVPMRSKFSREIAQLGCPSCRSTIFAPDREFARDAMIERLADEILSIIQPR